MTIEEMKQRKKELGYTNQQLSSLSGVPVGTVSKILSGATSCPRFETIQALERVLKKDMWDSWRTEEDGNPANEEKACYPDYNGGNGGLFVSEAVAAYGKKTGYTLEDYLNLPEDGPRKELIDGTFYDMAQPTVVHQMIISFLMNKLTNYIWNNKGQCVLVTSPVAVQLDADDKTVVEPDILVICDRSKITSRLVTGAPDLVIEVLSPSTRKKDMGIKAYKYQNAGVREYWLIDPKAEQILVYDYEKEAFPVIYGFEDVIPVQIWAGECRIDLKEMKDYISFLKE